MSSPATAFDPRGLLAALDRHRVAYIIVGAFGRVVQGADEVTRGIDIVPSTREENLRRLDAALAELGARQPDGNDPSLANADRNQLEPLLEPATPARSPRSLHQSEEAEAMALHDRTHMSLVLPCRRSRVRVPSSASRKPRKSGAFVV